MGAGGSGKLLDFPLSIFGEDPMQQAESPITIRDNELYIGTLKVCRVVDGQTLEFYDKSRPRKDKRGSSFERVSVLQLVRAIAEVTR